MLKAVIGTAVAVAVLGGGGYLADNAVRDTTESQVATTIAEELTLAEKPQVELGGFPFSIALLTGQIPDATASADRVPVEMAGHPIELTAVQVRAEQIGVQANPATLGSVDATAILSHDALSTLAGVPVSDGGNGRLQVAYTLNVFGRQLTVGVSAIPVLDQAAQQIRLTDPQFQVMDTIFNLDVDALIDRLIEPIDVSLGYGLTLTAAVPTDAGLHLHATGTDVALPIS